MQTLHLPFSRWQAPASNRLANSKTGLLERIFHKAPATGSVPQKPRIIKVKIGDPVIIDDPDHDHCHHKARIVENNGTTLVVCDRRHRKFTVDCNTVTPLSSNEHTGTLDRAAANTH
jgi:hypothetical protein